MMNIRMTPLLLAGLLSAMPLATFAASGDGINATGTTSGATRNSTMLPDNNRPSVPSGANTSGRGPGSSIGSTGVNGPGSGAGGGTGAPGGGTGGAGGGTGSWTGKSSR
ncbi:hypothetical protein PMI34_03181 [Pseudomonas sp. GM74]|uniref:hypothetical protein n=1 Tax=Pseudomonas sp. GM74 TaxID=1144336 RepID=UPI0002709BF0|nr:hypothetical protein [Pseudomonas sp. GM74]EJM88808.1 hypothetical protein PMI34_03181 [Pseudomonas sp. GM74]